MSLPVWDQLVEQTGKTPQVSVISRLYSFDGSLSLKVYMSP